MARVVEGAAAMKAPPGRVDWFRVFSQLDRAGINLPSVAKDLDIPYQTLKSIRRFAEPRYEYGEKIVELWCFVFGKTPEQIPRKERELSVARAKG